MELLGDIALGVMIAFIVLMLLGALAFDGYLIWSARWQPPSNEDRR